MAGIPKSRRRPETRPPWVPPGRRLCPSSAPRALAAGAAAGPSQAVLAAGTGSGASPSRFSRLPSTGLSRPPRKSGPKKKVVGDCPETSNSEAAVTCLPDDALVEILSYLRAKTLCRFKCVSKDWCRLITDILLRRKSLQTLQGFFYGSGDNYGDFADLPGGSAPPFDRSLSFLTQQVGIQHIFLLDSCNGLLLFGHRNTMTWSMGYIVCNPTTEQWVAVPSSEEDQPFEQVSSHTFLIFEPTISSEFNLLQLWPTPVDIRVRTYSSESGVWSHRANRWDYSSMRYSGGIVNGMLHFVIPSTHDGQDQIVVIDVEGNIRKTIQTPENNGFLAFVGLSQGHLHCIKSHLTEATELSIWALEDYDAGEWVLKHTVSILELFGRMSCKLYFCFKVIAIHPDRNLVFFDQHWNHELISYDMDRKEVCALMTPEEIEKYTLDFGTEAVDLSLLLSQEVHGLDEKMEEDDDSFLFGPEDIRDSDSDSFYLEELHSSIDEMEYLSFVDSELEDDFWGQMEDDYLEESDCFEQV